MPATSLYAWVVFGAVIAVALATDLALLHRRPREVTLKEAALASAAWITLALLFNAFVVFSRGSKAGLEFTTGYIVEQSLSADNVLTFLIVLQAFGIPRRSEHKVLFYGVLGALLMRAVFVVAGVALLHALRGVLFLFGAILFVAGVRMLALRRRTSGPERNWLVRIARRFFPVSEDSQTEDFFTSRNGTRYATRMFLALIAVEAMDIAFAVDSVPAVLAITRDTFVVYSSNAFAILGLRSLYFVVADLLPRFRFLHHGVGVILVFAGTQMLASEWFAVPTGITLAVIAGVLTATILISLLLPLRQGPARR